MKKNKNNNNTSTPVKRSQILKKTLTSGMFFLSVSSYSVCMKNAPEGGETLSP